MVAIESWFKSIIVPVLDYIHTILRILEFITEYRRPVALGCMFGSVLANIIFLFFLVGYIPCFYIFLYDFLARFVCGDVYYSFYNNSYSWINRRSLVDTLNYICLCCLKVFLNRLLSSRYPKTL